MTDVPVFGVSNEPEAVAEPIAFKISGTHYETGERAEFEFHARGAPPFGSMMHLATSATSDASAQSLAVFSFLWHSLIEEDRARWKETLDSEVWLFPAEIFGELADWLSVAWTGRPLRSRSARRAGTRSNGSTSTAKRAVTASRPSLSSPSAKRSASSTAISSTKRPT